MPAYYPAASNLQVPFRVVVSGEIGSAVVPTCFTCCESSRGHLERYRALCDYRRGLDGLAWLRATVVGTLQSCLPGSWFAPRSLRILPLRTMEA